MNTMIPSWIMYPFPLWMSTPLCSSTPASLVSTHPSPITTSECTTQFFSTESLPTSGAPSPCRYPVSWCPMKILSRTCTPSPSTTHGPTMESTTTAPSPTTTPSDTMEPSEYTSPRKRAGGRQRGTV